jgi:hypothetical protein
MMIQEKITDNVNQGVRKVYGNTTYKQVPIAEVTRIFVFWIALKQKSIKALFLSQQQNDNTDEVITKSINNILFKLRFVPVNFILGFWDFIKWIIAKKRIKQSPKEADILICVNHKKHKSFIREIALKLEQEGQRVVYFHWPLAKDSKYDLPISTSLPKFWTKPYLRARLCCSFIDYAHATLKDLKPKKVIVVEGDSYEHHIFGLLKRGFSFQCICLQWGYEPRSALRIGYRNMPYDKFLVWGDFFRNTFRNHNQNIEIKSVGHPQLQLHAQPKEVSGEHLLFALQRPMVPYVTKEDISELIHLAIRTAQRFPNRRIIVRNHPNYDIPNEHLQALNETSNIDIHKYENHTINQSLQNARYCISISSTLGFEAMYHGVFPLFITCNQIPLLLHSDMRQFNDGMHVIEKNELIKTLEQNESKVLTLPDKALFFKHSKEEATVEIAGEILN